MFEHIGKMNDMLGSMADSLSDDEKRILGITADNEPDRVLRQGVAKSMMEDAMAVSQQHAPLGQARAVDRKDLYPWQGKESDAELMFNFELPTDAQDLYDFIIESGLCLPGEVRLHMSDHQSSVHFASSVLVQKPDVIQMAMIAYEDQLVADDDEAFESLAEAVDEVLAERAIQKVPKAGALAKKGKKKPSPRGSAEPKGTGRSVDFNPFHDKSGKFSGRDEIKSGGSWSDGKKVRLKATTKKGGKLHFAGTKRPCGREARGQGKDMRCWDGNKGFGFALAKMQKKKRTSNTPMPGYKGEWRFDGEDLRLIQECREMYKTDLSMGDRESKTMSRFLEAAELVIPRD